MTESPSRRPETSRLATGRTAKTKRISSAAKTILVWLEENYCMIPGSCLARSELYSLYEEFCRKESRKPHSPASFGKVVRIKFPKVSTRRLGTRGQSKYHYYGLGVKETSIYYKRKANIATVPRRGITRFTNNQEKRSNDNINSGLLKNLSDLPSFPFFKGVEVEKLPQNKVETFMLMYSSHCQRIFDSVSRRNFDEVQDFLVHFWTGMPSHMLPSLENQILLDIIVVYDSILYNSLCNTLIPDTLTEAPGIGNKDLIVLFPKRLTEWLIQCLNDPLPQAVRDIKMQTADMFTKALRHHLNLLESAKHVRHILSMSKLVGSAAADMEKMKSDTLIHHIKTVTMKSKCLNAQEIATEFAINLQGLLQKQSNIEGFLLWIDGMIEEHIIKIAGSEIAFKLELLYDFYLLWNCFASYIEVETITTKAESQETFQVLFRFLTEYIIYITELVQSEKIEEDYSNSILSRAQHDQEQCCMEDSIRPFKCDTDDPVIRETSIYLNQRPPAYSISSVNSYESSLGSPVSSSEESSPGSLLQYPVPYNDTKLADLFEYSDPILPQSSIITDTHGRLEESDSLELPYFSEPLRCFEDIIELTDKLLGNPW
ncbi:PREDICTED: transcription factor RFX4-like [Amphimedon queenslandica]|uniref:RFX-type winged-helix domain-containing protein n=1 Tax=Amphimedon queenslandica TaxID=400682 RepID=A0A1X7V6E4_AMPQE|nr:PREDICTED: transcription factor RFX4-like [Amphimedon queenslandica]|eukprot:XP_019850482.1 PREDICTED: transcription factor RFX4-like [Amphimedon queenslandica]